MAANDTMRKSMAKKDKSAKAPTPDEVEAIFYRNARRFFEENL